MRLLELDILSCAWVVVMVYKLIVIEVMGLQPLGWTQVARLGTSRCALLRMVVPLMIGCRGPWRNMLGVRRRCLLTVTSWVFSLVMMGWLGINQIIPRQFLSIAQKVSKGVLFSSRSIHPRSVDVFVTWRSRVSSFLFDQFFCGWLLLVSHWCWALRDRSSIWAGRLGILHVCIDFLSVVEEAISVTALSGRWSLAFTSWAFLFLNILLLGNFSALSEWILSLRRWWLPAVWIVPIVTCRCSPVLGRPH